MAETKKTEAAAAAAPPEAACLTLRQKLVEMRKACPEIVKKQHSDGVSYKYAKIYDVWEKITPIMNELGVDFEVIGEKATRYAENGDPVYWITMQTKTYNGDKLMFLYEADLTIRWLNLDNDDETIEALYPDGFTGWDLEHAGVMETSLMLLFHPDLVDLGKTDDPLYEGLPAELPNYDVLPIVPGYTPPSGCLSSPVESSREKGAILRNVAVKHMVEAVKHEFSGEGDYHEV